MDVFINLLHFCPPWMRLDSTFCWNMGKVYYWHVSDWFYNRPLLIPFFVKVYQRQNHPVKDSLKITCGKLQVLEVMGTIISKVVQCMNQRLSKNSNSKSHCDNCLIPSVYLAIFWLYLFNILHYQNDHHNMKMVHFITE